MVLSGETNSPIDRRAPMVTSNIVAASRVMPQNFSVLSRLPISYFYPAVASKEIAFLRRSLVTRNART